MPQLDPNKQYSVEEPIIPPQQQKQAPQEDRRDIKFRQILDPSKNYLVEEPVLPESWTDWGVRNIATLGKNVVQGVLGFPGDIMRTAQAVAGLPAKAIGKISGIEPSRMTGEVLKAIGKEAGPEETERTREAFKALGMEEMPVPMPKLPGAREIGKGIKNVSERLFGVDPSYFKPKGEIEKILHSSAKDAASYAPFLLFGPVGWGSAGLMALRSVAPNITKVAAKTMGAGKTTQRLTKLGTQLAIGTFELFKPKNASSLNYKIADSSLSKYEKMKSGASIKGINRAEKTIGLDITTAVDKEVNSVLSGLDFVKRAPGGKVDVRRMINAKNKISQTLRDRKVSNEAKKIIRGIRGGLYADFKAHGKDVNKAFGKSFQLAEGLQRMMHGNTRAYKYIKTFTDTWKGAGLGVLSSIGLGIIKGSPGAALATAGAAIGVRGSLRVLDALASSAPVQKYFMKIIAAANAQNASQLGRLLGKFDAEMSREFGEEANKPIS